MVLDQYELASYKLRLVAMQELAYCDLKIIVQQELT